MTWVLLLVVAWLVIALLLAVLVGRGIRLAERRSQEIGPEPGFEQGRIRLVGNVVADPDAAEADPPPQPPPARGRAARRFRS
jgi:hypothetical protein